MSYPTLEQYNYAMQHPKLALIDPELKAGTIVKTGLGLPLALCGGFALTYTITSGGKKYAVRCFHKQSNHLEARYNAISNRLNALRSSYFVDFRFQSEGVTVDGKKHPIVKMTWASGKTLGEFMAGNYRNKSFLQELNKSLLSIARYLERERISHGDIQPGNVMVANEGRSIQLIDYDGMFVEDLKSLGGTELGLVNFQHPARNGSNWDYRLDRFSFILLNFAIRVLETHPDLWSKAQSDENAILFRAQDFTDPGNSEIFQRLIKDTQFKDDARNFASICKAPFDKIPTPDEFLAGRNIPQVAVTISPTGKITRTGYFGAYPVLDATSYELCIQYVGDRVELIGQIAAVVKNTTRYGGRPYIFINFGEDWTEDIVKLNIWSDGLEALSDAPDKSWEGKWVSVVGLMEPPYHSEKYGYTHLAISITQDNQLHFISEQEAEFRLSGSVTATSKASTRTGNREILESMREADSSACLPSSTSRSSTLSSIPARPGTQPAKPAYSQSSSSVPPRPATANQRLLRNMKASQSRAAPVTTPVHAQASKAKVQQPKQKTISRQKTSTWLAWLGSGIAVLCFLAVYVWSRPSSNAQTVPTRRPVPTATSKPTKSALIVPATKKASCMSWTEVNEGLDGKVRCVYGIVTSRRSFTREDGEFSYTLIRFGDDPDSFYLTSHDEPLFVSVEDCISAEARISYDANGVPFMEVSKIAKNKYSCSE